MKKRRVITEAELEGPSSSQRVHDPNASTPIQRSVPIPPVLVLESQQKTCEDLTDRLLEAKATVAGLEAELKQKDCEIAALKERLQASEQKLQREEARNAWLNEGTLTSELQTLRSEEEHEDQIVVREKMFLKHARYLTITVGDEEAPPNISRAAVILCHRNDILYTSAERQEQLDGPFTSFPDWNCAMSSEGGTINVPAQFRGEQCALFVKCPCCRISFHRDMMRKFYMERIAPQEHAATYFGDPVQLRRSSLILPFLFKCLDRYITMFEAGPYDLRAELKHLLSFYLRREIADREEIADYM
ncbi:hypothetical protein R1flu_015859 [Riccia fluitans]|uniref:Uncharacterized protein n=1 Tax=Riccia fluitans TaxID=41844 RepID=A0ABD1YK53_9MARC